MTAHTCGQAACSNKAHEVTTADLLAALDKAAKEYGAQCVAYGAGADRAQSAAAFDFYITARNALARQLGVPE